MARLSPSMEHKLATFETYLFTRFALDSVDGAPVLETLQKALQDISYRRHKSQSRVTRLKVEKRGKVIIYDFAARQRVPPNDVA